MKNDYTAGFQVFCGVFGTLLRGYCFIKIASEYVPHVNFPSAIVAVKCFHLRQLYTAVWRPKNVWFNKIGCFEYVTDVGILVGFPTVDVVVGMVTTLVTAADEFIINIWVLLHVITYTKEGSFSIVKGQLL